MRTGNESIASSSVHARVVKNETPDRRNECVRDTTVGLRNKLPVMQTGNLLFLARSLKPHRACIICLSFLDPRRVPIRGNRRENPMLANVNHGVRTHLSSHSTSFCDAILKCNCRSTISSSSQPIKRNRNECLISGCRSVN